MDFFWEKMGNPTTTPVNVIPFNPGPDFEIWLQINLCPARRLYCWTWIEKRKYHYFCTQKMFSDEL